MPRGITVSRAPFDMLQRVCGTCGVSYHTSDGRSKYCSESCVKASRASRLRHRQAKHRSAHPTRERARQALKNAIRAGKIRRVSVCEQCREVSDTQGHHEDYGRPFYVQWLCSKCHAGLDGGRHFGAGQPKPDDSLAARQAS